MQDYETLVVEFIASPTNKTFIDAPEIEVGDSATAY